MLGAGIVCGTHCQLRSPSAGGHQRPPAEPCRVAFAMATCRNPQTRGSQRLRRHAAVSPLSLSLCHPAFPSLSLSRYLSLFDVLVSSCLWLFLTILSYLSLSRARSHSCSGSHPSSRPPGHHSHINLMEWCPAITHTHSLSLSVFLSSRPWLSLAHLSSLFFLAQPLALALSFIHHRAHRDAIDTSTCCNGVLPSPFFSPSLFVCFLSIYQKI